MMTDEQLKAIRNRRDWHAKDDCGCAEVEALLADRDEAWSEVARLQGELSRKTYAAKRFAELCQHHRERADRAEAAESDAQGEAPRGWGWWTWGDGRMAHLFTPGELVAECGMAVPGPNVWHSDGVAATCPNCKATRAKQAEAAAASAADRSSPPPARVDAPSPLGSRCPYCAGSGWYGARQHNPLHYAEHRHCHCKADCEACARGEGFRRTPRG